MTNIAFYFLPLVILLSNACLLEKQPNFIFVKCINERTKEFYSFGIDSTISLTESGGRWKAKKRKIGTWVGNQNEIITTINSITVNYQNDTLQHLLFLISEDNIKQWKIIKRQITEDILNDELLNILKTYELSEKNKPEDREQVIERAEYDVALRKICGLNILIRLPSSLSLD